MRGQRPQRTEFAPGPRAAHSLSAADEPPALLAPGRLELAIGRPRRPAWSCATAQWPLFVAAAFQSSRRDQLGLGGSCPGHHRLRIRPAPFPPSEVVISLAAHAAPLLLSLSLAAPALASDWYVDAIHGSNANGGASPADAWRSITWALANTPTTGAQRIYVAPGAYGHTTGEQFPLQLRPGTELIGAPGPVRPVIGQPTGLAFNTASVAVSTQVTDVLPPNAQVRVENLAFSRGWVGVGVYHSAPGALTVVVEGADFQSVRSGIAAAATEGAAFALQLERVRYENQLDYTYGVSISGGLAQPSSLVARNCTIIGARVGVSLSSAVDARFERCRIEGSRWHGVYVSSSPNATVNSWFESCLLADSSNYGFRHVGDGSSTLEFERCAVAGNPVGLSIQNSASAAAQVELDQCIFANALVDLAVPPSAIVRDSLIRSGQFSGANGNFAADPLFVDPGSGDWGLRWGSPCIDRITAPSVASVRDLTGRRRGVDGDLDTLARSDLGAIEFRPLAAALEARIGGPLTLGSWGPTGAASTVYWARSSPVGPASTPFGQLALPPAAIRVFALTSTSAFPPTTLQRSIPNAPALVGQTYSFQALVDSPAAPQGLA